VEEAPSLHCQSFGVRREVVAQAAIHGFSPRCIFCESTPPITELSRQVVGDQRQQAVGGHSKLRSRLQHYLSQIQQCHEPQGIRARCQPSKLKDCRTCSESNASVHGCKFRMFVPTVTGSQACLLGMRSQK
jgi:hypothetical protein